MLNRPPVLECEDKGNVPLNSSTSGAVETPYHEKKPHKVDPWYIGMGVL